MAHCSRIGRATAVVAMLMAVAASVVVVVPPRASGDTVTMKNGVVYHGIVDQDNSIVSIFDGLRRVVLHNTRIARRDPDPASHGGQEHFRLIQPMEGKGNGGQMPAAAYAIQASPWDENGRRTFSYLGPKMSRRIVMTQAINDLGPSIVKLRGVDGFWQGQIATGQVPRPIVLGLLHRDKDDEKERLRICRFLIQAEWYPEAKAELDRLAKDFPETRDRARDTRLSVQDLEARANLAEIDVCRAAQQPKEVLSRLQGFPTRGVAADVLASVRGQLDREKSRLEEDRALASALQGAADGLSPEVRKATRGALIEMLRDLTEVPDAARPRLEAFQKALADTDRDAGARFALAISGWAVGPDFAVADLRAAQALWEARGLVFQYLRSRTDDDRAESLQSLQAVEVPAPEARKLDLETVTRLARHLPPPHHDEQDEPGRVKTYRVLDDPNPVPTEYAVLLPPEYHPSRSYPAVVALHNGNGPASAVAWWAAEASRRGYVVIAPEYSAGPPADYHFTPTEHAAAELSLRDARKRFSIDGDRVFLGGQGLGGEMAWDFGLGHPDLFAGIVTVSGLPAKYVLAYKAHARRVPLYIVMGDLSPATRETLDMVKEDMITRSFDATFVEHYRRGQEDFPEEAPSAFDWMAPRRRDPYPRKFDVVTARECDDRFYGVVVRDLAAGVAPAPEAVDIFGKGLRPATIGMASSTLSNLVRVTTTGVRRLDVWVGPNLLDFSKKLEVKVNNKRFFYGMAKPDFEPMLEDLRLRGDREQIYWLKVPVAL